MRLIIDRQKCIGSGDCVISAPALFGQGDDGVAVLMGESVTEDLGALAFEAAANCPSGALKIAQEETGR
jgi:ferredoxin